MKIVEKYVQPITFMKGDMMENINEIDQISKDKKSDPSEDEGYQAWEDKAIAQHELENDNNEGRPDGVVYESESPSEDEEKEHKLPSEEAMQDYEDKVIAQGNREHDERIRESAMAPEASEFMAGEKLQNVTGDLGLAGSVEKADGEVVPDNKVIQTLLDRMKELTDIMGNKPDVQWEGGSNNSLAGGVTEMKPDVVKRAETTTGAPSIKLLKNPDAVSDGSTSKSEGGESESSEKKENPFAKKDSSEKKDDSEKKENPFAKKDSSEKKENPFAKKDDSEKKEPVDGDDEDEDDKDELDEISSHNLSVRHNKGLNLVKEQTDEEILLSDDMDKLYEGMYRTSNDIRKCMLFKERLDTVKKENKLNEAIAKMRRRF